MSLVDMTIEAAPEYPSSNRRIPGKSEIDLQALADRIVDLLKQEARIERERLGGGRPWSKKVTHE